MSNINLIARDNGAGLTRDMHLLADLLREGGHDVTITGLGHRSRLSNRLRRLHARLRRLLRGWFKGQLNARYDINIMLEHVRPESFDQAHINILIPNPEWFRSEWLPELPHFDFIFAKTRHAERIFSERGCRTVFIGFTGADYLDTNVARLPTFLHGPGRSGNKGTLPLLALWAQHPQWPPLTVVWRRKHVELQALPANVQLIREYLPEETLRQLHNANLFHLCPSQTEGYGHSLVESLSTGCITITTDAEPMNELVTEDRGLLVSAHTAGTQELATLYDFDPDAMRGVIEQCIAMPEEKQKALGRAAREWYETNQRTFRQRFLQAIADVAPRQTDTPR
ncbi:glycosyltransferase [Dyella caseinilytica]|uniref:Glycosyltransferase n=1 Tax=Dyella caseinilytica TaxID=1849581 RepID=A0ABX7GWE5_9GAMM|nr:glycosyltransferase [Dyella caseinilytica]QRN53525.1 glycosyltransferase [Dyella caseinilytica]GFZ87075.1 glycosyl transferase [Dyella caseinilytica]